jgi:hypothetical protein
VEGAAEEICTKTILPEEYINS